MSGWLILQHLADLVKLYGQGTSSSTPADTPNASAPPTKRQGTITIGKGACELAQVVGLFQTLGELQRYYGNPNFAPQDVFLAEQRIVTALLLCGIPVQGLRQPSLPGRRPRPQRGPLGSCRIPNPILAVQSTLIRPAPAAQSIRTRPTLDRPSGRPTDGQSPTSTSRRLMAALQILEVKFGTFGNPSVPGPVVLIMEHIITTLIPDPSRCRFLATRYSGTRNGDDWSVNMRSARRFPKEGEPVRSVLYTIPSRCRLGTMLGGGGI